MNKKGQNILEYVIVLAAFIVVYAVFLGPQGPFRNILDDTLDESMNFFEAVVNNVNSQ
jgi:hypothetical protein